MGVDVGVEGPVPRAGFAGPGRRRLAEKQIDQMARPPAADVHGLDAGNAIHGDILGRHLPGPFLHQGFHLGVRDDAIEAVAATDAVRSRGFRLDRLDIHPGEEGPDGFVDSRLVARRAGVEDGHLRAAVVGEGEGRVAGQNLPQRDGRDPVVERPEALVAARADVDDPGPARQAGFMAAADMMLCDRAEPFGQDGRQPRDKVRPMKDEGAARGEHIVHGAPIIAENAPAFSPGGDELPRSPLASMQEVA